MQRKLLQILVCPKCLGELSCAVSTESENGIDTGTLTCNGCKKSFEINAGIPRFVESDNYASSFGYQWNRFKAEQIDSLNGTRLSERRFYSETGWTKDWLQNKWILDAGCGAGRFLDVASKNTSCEVVGVDISNAVDAAHATLSDRENVHLVQASIYELPFRDGAFDGCYCIGVIQHTPDPAKALRSLPRLVKEGGRLAVTIYERKPWTPLNTKYLIRPLTKRVNPKFLLSAIKASMVILFPVTDVLFRIPFLGRVMSFAIPVANYVNDPELTTPARYRWAILDTFDMLAPQYDQPQVEEDAAQALKAGGLTEIKRLNNPGLNLTGQKLERAASEEKHMSASLAFNGTSGSI
jgi:SAM-dependent methyltransferase